MRGRIIYLLIDLMVSVPHGRGDIVEQSYSLWWLGGRETERSMTVGERTGDREGKREKDAALLVDFLLFLFILSGSPAYGILWCTFRTDSLVVSMGKTLVSILRIFLS